MKMTGDGMTKRERGGLQVLKWVNWAVLGLLAFVLLFTKVVLANLGMENTLQSVVTLVVPLMLVAIGIEWMTRRQK